MALTACNYTLFLYVVPVCPPLCSTERCCCCKSVLAAAGTSAVLSLSRLSGLKGSVILIMHYLTVHRRCVLYCGQKSLQ